MPTVLATMGRRTPTKNVGLGPLWPIVGKPVGITTHFYVCYLINARVNRAPETELLEPLGEQIDSLRSEVERLRRYEGSPV